MEIVLAIILFIVVCGVLMFWDYYKPARFRTTYANVHKHKGTRDAGSLAGLAAMAAVMAAAIERWRRNSAPDNKEYQ